jgi:hypothetical protein
MQPFSSAFNWQRKLISPELQLTGHLNDHVHMPMLAHFGTKLKAIFLSENSGHAPTALMTFLGFWREA